MNRITTWLPLLAGLLLAGPVPAQQVPAPAESLPQESAPQEPAQAEPQDIAQQAPAAPAPQPAFCPQLPAAAGLVWEARSSADGDFCRALRSDGSEAFGLYITAQPSFEPSPRNREESSSVAGHSVIWYRAEIATNPGVQARETLLPLADGRYAHIWLQADSVDALAAGYRLLASLRFGDGASGQAAGD